MAANCAICFEFVEGSTLMYGDHAPDSGPVASLQVDAQRNTDWQVV